jgi:cell division protein FtsI (penicillin-binding protein 3)
VVINEPKGEDYGGGAAAAPVFSSVTRGALRILNIVPSELESLAETVKKADGGAA